MDNTKDENVAISPRRSLDNSVPKEEMNADELRLAQMGLLIDYHILKCLTDSLQGHTQELNRHFSTLSLIGLASTTTISWTGLGLGLITEIGAGGPGAVIYGFILVTILQCFLGASLAEFVSSYPTEGGMYHWIAAVAPRRTTGILSFLTGWFSVLGCKSFRGTGRETRSKFTDILRDLYYCIYQHHLCTNFDGSNRSVHTGPRDQGMADFHRL